ncbi:MAG: thiamine phosphate synthase [Boseongicola sp. SB0673_bin_14]|nr:thiamine phosphate synthase [Boseongicola sp.]MXW86878.1 thiamine phosphate synthase [Boseongicola sp. SB0667_bin_21]MYI67405.1 thiamine phosphate synthase [Boseongicola sp. SB0673_bin_14]
MAGPDKPQIYLLTPPEFDLPTFRDQLAAVMDAHEVACLRLAMATRDEVRLSRAADALREAAHARDVAIVIESHLAFARDLGLDGIHLVDGARSVRKARGVLGKDAIVGAYCHASRHDGMNAAEAGASYVAFGPVGASALGDGTLAERDLFAWWSEMIELPVVAEGNLDTGLAASLAPATDFFGIGEEIWRQEDPAEALAGFVRALG